MIEWAVFTARVPVRVEQLASIRARVRGWMADCAITHHARHDVVWAASEALSSAIDHLRGRPGSTGSEATLTLHVDPDVVVLTATDHFAWTDPGPAAVDGLRVIGEVTDRVTLTTDPDTRVSTLVAVFPR
ncbi:ATP-binding protein [Actinokineospora globicatena]|uniref:ATP-binding protein n=1 Tax=Actinokineospora globicatena TaxID=103729 RepID=UPI0020A3ACE0|nr:ATP-binding protein [Actinokineospora globicatena]